MIVTLNVKELTENTSWWEHDGDLTETVTSEEAHL